MINQITQAAVLAAGQADFNPNETVNRIRALAILLISLALIIVSFVAVLQAGRRGNNAKAFNIMSASVISLVPAVIGVIGALAVGAAVFGWAVPGLSS